MLDPGSRPLLRPGYSDLLMITLPQLSQEWITSRGPAQLGAPIGSGQRELERIEAPTVHRKAPPRGLTPEERRRLLLFADAQKSTGR